MNQRRIRLRDADTGPSPAIMEASPDGIGVTTLIPGQSVPFEVPVGSGASHAQA